MSPSEHVKSCYPVPHPPVAVHTRSLLSEAKLIRAPAFAHQALESALDPLALAAMSKFKAEHPIGENDTAWLYCRVGWPGARDCGAAALSKPSCCSPGADKRKAEAARIKEKYPDRVPVSRAQNSWQ